MKKINEQQIQTIINKLAEAPAKFVFDTILILQNLQNSNEEQLQKKLEELQKELEELQQELNELKNKDKDGK